MIFTRRLSLMQFLRTLFPAREPSPPLRYVHYCNDCGTALERGKCPCGGSDVRLRVEEA